MKKILMLGGTRFFGKHAVRDFLEKGYAVSIATRQHTADDFGDRVTRIQLDRFDKSSLQSALQGKHFDIIVDNLAYSSKDVEDILSVVCCDRYVVTSSSAVYQGFSGTLQEDVFDAKQVAYKCIPYEQVDSYAHGKQLVEATLHQKFATQNFVCVRFPYVIGEDDYTNRFQKYVQCFANEVPLNIEDIEAKYCVIGSVEAGKFLSFIADQSFVGSIHAQSDGLLYIKELMLSINPNYYKKALFQVDGSEKEPYDFKNYGFALDTSLAKSLGFKFQDSKLLVASLSKYFTNRDV